MTETFTPTLLTEKSTPSPTDQLADGPSAWVIRNVLNYSKSLEIKRSKLVQAVEIVKT